VLRAIVSSGWIGVDVFFVLSGFVHFLPVAKRGSLGSWRGYAWRRIARVVPAYYLCLLVVIYLTKTIDVAGLLAHLAFLQVPLFGFSRRTGLNADQPLWTLSIEAAFYVVMVFTATRFFRHPGRWLAGALVVAVGWKIATASDVNKGMQFPGFVAHFALGMAAAWLYVQATPALRARLHRLAPWAVGVAFVAFVLAARALIDSDGPHHMSRNLTLAVPLTVLLLGAALLRVPGLAAVRFLSTVSYGTYLFHILLVGRLLRFSHADGDAASFLRSVAMVVPLSLLIGWLSYALVENPVRKWARRVA
jgi:peptidoglycan/LPS O-acetylase OafA/YrhL